MKIGFKNKMTGVCGEDAACSFLKKNKYKIIERNFRCLGVELDIIASKGEDLCFIEVKTRSSEKFGTPAQAVTYYKKQNMIKAAKLYLMNKPSELNIRFDIIEVYGSYSSGGFFLESINHIENVIEEV